MKDKADFTEESNRFFYELRNYIVNNNNLFTTIPVIKEICNVGHYDYKKIIKREGQCRNRELLRLRRMIKKEEQEKRRVVDAFVDNGKLIILKDEMKNIYDKMLEKYQGFREEYNLSYANLDFLLIGITFVITSSPVIFASNDYGIFYARNKVLKRENLEEQKARFFTRIDFF